MAYFKETALTCVECGKQGTYTYGWDTDTIVCINGECVHSLSTIDLMLDEGEFVAFNDDNVLCVYRKVE
jgi:hypothetical protein